MLAPSRLFDETSDKRNSVCYYDYRSDGEEQKRYAVTISKQRTVGVLI